MHYEWSCLGDYMVSLAPCKFVGVVPRSTLEHSQADTSNVAADSMTCIVFGDAFSQKMVVIVPERILTFESSQRSSLIDGFEDAAVPGFAPAVAVTTTEFFISHQATVTKVLSAVGESMSIDHNGDDADGSPDANTRNFTLASYESVLPGNLGKTSLELELAAAIEVDALVKNSVNEVSRLAGVSVPQGESLLLVEDPNTGAHNIIVATGQQSQFVQSAVGMEHLVQESGAEQGTEFSGIDLVGLRAMQEQAVLEGVADQDSVDDLHQFQIQPVHFPTPRK